VARRGADPQAITVRTWRGRAAGDAALAAIVMAWGSAGTALPAGLWPGGQRVEGWKLV